MSSAEQRGSWSLTQPDYWWYRARADLLESALGPYLGSPSRILDVGSADGPSVGWVRARDRRLCVDVDPRGLPPGQGVCASADAIPFGDHTFDAAVAFDVVEHCPDRHQALTELARVLRPGGRLLVSVPAYRWAWSDHDVRAGHYTRYTRPRIVADLRAAGLTVDRATYAFMAVFPMFAAERAVRKLRAHNGGKSSDGVPQVGPLADRVLRGLSRVDQRLLQRHDLPFGSSVFVAAHAPGPGAPA
ncbi:MAG: class I SAM-dependent methyltransferase [Marmoricola sp.]